MKTVKSKRGQSDYQEFLKAKINLDQGCGFDVSDSEIHPILKPHQRVAVKWAIKGGRRALFENFGLGKTLQQLEICRLMLRKLGSGRALIVTPLGVRQEFKRDAIELLGWDRPPQFVRFSVNVLQYDLPPIPEQNIFLTNYESIRDGRLDPNLFDIVSLDEASILRGFGGTKTFREFMRHFEGNAKLRYRFVATATPSPNEYIELLAYAAFLEIMDVGQAKTRFFKRDSTKADQLTIHPHKEKEFWLWVASWALFLQSPADLGYDATGYELPEMKVIKREVAVDHRKANSDRAGQGRLFREATHGVVEAAREKRDTLAERITAMKQILRDNPNDHFLIWHDLEAERAAIEKAVPEAVTVYGTQDLDEREQSIIGFSNGEIKYLATKPVLAGSGCNFQRYCHKAIFLGIGFKFNEFIQGIHRIQRFLQTELVEIYLIYAESERTILKTLERKWSQHDEMVNHMTEIIQKYGLSNAAMASELARVMGVERVEVTGENYRLINNDCVPEVKRIPDNSIHLMLTSIPFSTQYEYSPNYCYDEATEVLSDRGWINFGELAKVDRVGTVRLDTGAFEWQIPQAVIWERYHGKMVQVRNKKNLDLLVTSDHSLIVAQRVNGGRPVFGKVRAETVLKTFNARKWLTLGTAHPGTYEQPSEIRIPQLQPAKKGPKAKVVDVISIRDCVELAGWYVSEGYCDAVDGKHGGRISLCQCAINEAYRQEIASLLRRIGLQPRFEERAIVAHNKSLAAFLIREFGSGSYNKRLPRWIKDLSPEMLIILRDTMMKGDGQRTGYAYGSVSRLLKDDFQEICFLTGWRAVITSKGVNISRQKTLPQIREAPALVDYSGMIGCVTVPNGSVVVRRNGIITVSGNCDFGHSDDNEHFFEQMDFLTPDLLRVLSPGRLACVHVKDRIVPGGMTGLGFQTVYPFHARCIEHYTKHGFGYLGMKTIVTDVVRENNQTYRLGWTEQCKDGTKMGVGMPEYLLMFRKPPTEPINSYADIPVVKSKRDYSRSRWQVDAHGFMRSSGDRLLTPEQIKEMPHALIFKMFRKYSLEQVYDFEHHVRLGESLETCGQCGHIHTVPSGHCECGCKGAGRLPVSFMLLQPQSWQQDVWTDITRMLTLNTSQYSKGKEMHLCPLQFDVADRVISQLTMPGETVLDPFGGLMTVPYRAIKLKRKAIGIELSAKYFLDGAAYCKAAEKELDMPKLFDTLPDAEFEEEDIPAEAVNA